MSKNRFLDDLTTSSTIRASGPLER